MSSYDSGAIIAIYIQMERLSSGRACTSPVSVVIPLLQGSKFVDDPKNSVDPSNNVFQA
jgi:hypothetical protein